MFEVKLDINPVTKVLSDRGLDSNGETQKFFTQEVYRLSDPYTPFRTGVLKQGAVTLGNSYIDYNASYAERMWNAVGKNINYQGAPMRGKMWTMRMWADRKEEIIQSLLRKAGLK